MIQIVLMLFNWVIFSSWNTIFNLFPQVIPIPDVLLKVLAFGIAIILCKLLDVDCMVSSDLNN